MSSQGEGTPDVQVLAARSWRALAYAVPIRALGSLIGLGGAEFRLPVLVGPLGYPARRAVPLNLAVSPVTISASLVIRGNALSYSTLAPYALVIGGLITGAVVAAFAGTALVHRLSTTLLNRIILVLLVGIGLALLVESVTATGGAGLVPPDAPWRVGTAIAFGLVIGAVSSLLGVAGGELIIPTLVFAFGLDIKTAGTASLLISLPTVAVGVARHAARGAFPRPDVTATVVPMGLGSVVGALLGGLLVGLVPTGWVKAGLGTILIFSAWRIFSHSRAPAPGALRDT